MKFTTARARLLFLFVAIGVVSPTSGCATPPLDSPVGEWVAESGDHGLLSIDGDGTFTITGSTYNPVQNRAALDARFDARGSWRVYEEGVVDLHFEASEQGVIASDPATIPVTFSDGLIVFTDPEQVDSIEYRKRSAR